MKYKRILALISVCIFIVVACTSLYFLTRAFKDKKDNNEAIEILKEDYIQIDEETREKTIEWEQLQSNNNDIVGWIQIEGTAIDYPILKDDKLFYLNHNYTRKYNNHGSIFTININPFIDEETIIYGHNMKNGSMFSQLGKYLSNEFFYSHNKFKIYTPTCDYEATVFSAYSIGVEVENNNIKSLDFNERINYYKKASKIHIEVDDNISKIAKLSTCSYINAKTNPTDQRYYIVASIIPI